MAPLARHTARWRRTGGALARYDRARAGPNRRSVCNAPSNNLYFRADGAVAPCWLQFHLDSPRWSPDGPTVRQIWTGGWLSELRERLDRHELTGACGTCLADIEVGNRPLAAAYDEIGVQPDWPTMVEVELSNQCNLECVMCSGMLSSRIRANREQLPPLEVPYDTSFVDQLEEFLPHLEELRINGGEPLMQDLVHVLLDRVARVRPELKVTVATNGTVLNPTVRAAMQRCNLHFNVSIDSLRAERYEAIRVHGRFDVLMRNVAELVEHCHGRGSTLCIMVNPMRQNWDELPRFVEWSNERDVGLWFNTIRYPEHVALHTLPADELRRIHRELTDAAVAMPESPTWLQRKNLGVFERFRDVQLPGWVEAAERGGDAAVVVQPPRRRSSADVRGRRR